MTLGSQLMTQRIEDGRIRRTAGLREVEIRRHVKMRLTFEDDLFDHVIAAVEYAGDAGIERRTFGETAHIARHDFTHIRFPPSEIVKGGELSHQLIALVN